MEGNEARASSTQDVGSRVFDL
ncbi:MAG: hypothetical protein HW409_1348, partial [candidate division NC10 bacterium]|nr:hypothetical protein [candidate division NC10 bacterium]